MIHRGRVILLTIAVGILSGSVNAQVAEKTSPYQVWVEDALVKVFRDSTPTQHAAARVSLDVARGEYESAQIVVRPTEKTIAFLKVYCGALKSADGAAMLAAPQVRYVDYVPLFMNSAATPPAHRVAQSPAWVPDPLYEVPHTDAWVHQARPVWLTFHIPRDARPGKYVGQAEVIANDEVIPVPIELVVHDAVVPAERHLKVTDWVRIDMMAYWGGTELWSERFWEETVRDYARSMADHRLNMILAPMSIFWSKAKLVDITAEGDRLRFDFSKLDRWVEIFMEEGVIGYIEGGHIGQGGRVHCWLPRDGKIVYGVYKATEPEAREYLSQFFAALYAHLQEKGWTDIYYQHIMDEPNDATRENYQAALDLLRRHAPGIKSIDALLSSKIATGDVLVPILYLPNHGNLRDDFEKFKALQQQGRELWYYTCGAVQGTHVSFHLDQRLLRVRYMNWLNFKYNLAGYLYWGFNWWDYLSPFTQTQIVHSPAGPFPPGDHCLVYPGPDGLIDSLRYEAQRDSIEDYELLRLLAEKDGKKARAICDRAVHDFDAYEMDVRKFRLLRRELLESLSGKQNP